MTGIFATIINGFLLLTNFEESPIVYVPKHTFASKLLDRVELFLNVN